MTQPIPIEEYVALAIPEAFIKEYEHSGQKKLIRTIFEHPIYSAIRQNDLALVEKLIPTLPDINASYVIGQDSRQATYNPFGAAVVCCNLKAMELLVRYGTNINALNEHKQSVLLYAVNREEIPNLAFEFLLAHNADIFMPQSKVECWVWEALIFNHDITVRYYLDALASQLNLEGIEKVEQYLSTCSRKNSTRLQVEYTYSLLKSCKEKLLLGSAVSFVDNSFQEKNLHKI